MKQIEVPFIKKQITDNESIVLFQRAVNGAEKTNAFINYDVYFKMTMTMKDGKELDYYLNIENTEKPQIGLLIKLPNTVESYTLPEKTSEKLKQIIYYT